MEDGKDQAQGMQGPQHPVGIDASTAVASTAQTNALKVQWIAHKGHVGHVANQGTWGKIALTRRPVQ